MTAVSGRPAPAGAAAREAAITSRAAAPGPQRAPRAGTVTSRATSGVGPTRPITRATTSSPRPGHTVAASHPVALSSATSGRSTARSAYPVGRARSSPSALSRSRAAVAARTPTSSGPVAGTTARTRTSYGHPSPGIDIRTSVAPVGGTAVSAAPPPSQATLTATSTSTKGIMKNDSKPASCMRGCFH